MPSVDLSQYGTVSAPPKTGAVDLSQYGTVSQPTTPSDKEEKQSGVGQYFSTLGHDALSLPGNVLQMARHPIDTALDASAAQREKAKQDFTSGNYLDAVTHAIGGYAPIPYLPPFLADTLTDIGSKENIGRGAARLTEMGAGAILPKIVKSAAAKGVPVMHPLVETGLERLLHLPHGTISVLRDSFGMNGKGETPAAPSPGSGNTPGPYFNERSTVDPGMHGPTPSASAPNSTGTVNVPPPAPPEPPPGVNTNSPAGRVNPATRPAGTPATGTVDLTPPPPKPTLSTNTKPFQFGDRTLHLLVSGGYVEPPPAPAPVPPTGTSATKRDSSASFSNPGSDAIADVCE